MAKAKLYDIYVLFHKYCGLILLEVSKNRLNLRKMSRNNRNNLSFGFHVIRFLVVENQYVVELPLSTPPTHFD